MKGRPRGFDTEPPLWLPGSVDIVLPLAPPVYQIRIPGEPLGPID
jgi:hypothetical protein